MTSSPCGSCAAPVGDGARLCTGCTGKLRDLLRQAADIAPDLDDAVAKQLTRGNGGGGKRSEVSAPLPIDLVASEAKYQLSIKLGVAVRAVQLPPGAPCYAQDWPFNTIPHMARWLLARLDRIRQHEHAALLHDGIHRAVQQALAVIDRKPDRVPAGPCATCARTLMAELDTDTATCECGAVATGLLADRQARAEKAEVRATATDLAAALEKLGIKVLASTIRTWATRTRLVKHGVNPFGEPTYAMGDVIGLCKERDDRKSMPRVRG